MSLTRTPIKLRSTQQVSNSLNDDQNKTCNKFKKGATGTGARWAGCDLCLKWYHVKCTDMSDGIFDQLQDSNNSNEVLWMCEICESRKISTKKDISDQLKDSTNTIMNKLASQEKLIDSLREEINSVRLEV